MHFLPAVDDDEWRLKKSHLCLQLLNAKEIESHQARLGSRCWFSQFVLHNRADFFKSEAERGRSSKNWIIRGI